MRACVRASACVRAYNDAVTLGVSERSEATSSAVARPRADISDARFDSEPNRRWVRLLYFIFVPLCFGLSARVTHDVVCLLRAARAVDSRWTRGRSLVCGREKKDSTVRPSPAQ